jgi:uncharacterized protein YkwD
MGNHHYRTLKNKLSEGKHGMKLRSTFMRFVLLIALLGLVSTSVVSLLSVGAQEGSNDIAATRVLALVNQWRIEEGLPPLLLNPILQRMAEAQAFLIAPNINSITDESVMHKDAQGRTAIQRAIQVYDWPNYGIREQVEVGENAAHFSADNAVKFWKSSPIHRKAALNATYREVGIAAIPQKPKGSFVFYMTFGARPSVLTALVDPISNTIYLTKEESRYAFKSGQTPPKVSVRFYNQDRLAVTPELVWKNTINLPQNLGEAFYVRYTGYKEELWVEVNRARDIAILPVGTMTVAQQLTALNNISRPDAQPSATTSGDLITSVPSTRVFLATNTPSVIVVAPTATSTTAPTAVPAQPVADKSGNTDLTITYNVRTLFITNTSGGPLNIDGLQIGRLSLQSWLKIYPFNTVKFSNGYCLQANVSGAAGDP